MHTRVDSSGSPAQRVIRVFVSSTFADMQEDREELVKRVFPQLRKLSETRGVIWTEVDLRWGISDQQKAEGKVLPICMAEIQRCRPYFIGILGERYGWIPKEIPRDLMEREPWLAELPGRSVTELEILKGVLNNPAMAEHACFYFRSRAYLNTLPLEKQQAYAEHPLEEEVKELGEEHAIGRAEERCARLTNLKRKIRESGLPVREDYPDPRALGALVLADMSRVVDTLFPLASEPDALAREGFDHELFARSCSLVYVPRQDYFVRLDHYAASTEPPLVVVGESGLGKSALLANWGLRYRQMNPNDIVLMHFVGCTATSADWSAMLHRIIMELSKRFGFTVEIPNDPGDLCLAFASCLMQVPSGRKVVLIIDALNQLEDREGALDLLWLPETVAPSVRLVMSTLPGRPLDCLRRREGPVLQVGPLNVTEQRELIVDYLAQYSKSLDPSFVSRIIASKAATNALYLRSLLEEMRVYGDHRTLAQRLEDYLEAGNVEALFQKIFERYEHDFDIDRPELVRDTLTLLWASRNGLAESELMDLLGTSTQPLARAHWSPFYLTMEHTLTNRSGILKFSNEYFLRAIDQRYLQTKQQRNHAHDRLASYFRARPLGPRKLEEYPWQLAECEKWEDLKNLLAEQDPLIGLWATNGYEVRKYWTRVEQQSSWRIVDTYSSVVQSVGRMLKVHFATLVAQLLVSTGHLAEGLNLLFYLVELFRESSNRADLERMLGPLAAALRARGRLQEALEALTDKEQICRETRNEFGLIDALSGRGSLLSALGQPDLAMTLHKEEEALARRLGEKRGLAGSLGNQASILFSRGKFKESLALLNEVQRLYRELNDPIALAASLSNQAHVLKTFGRHEEAMCLFRDQEKIARELGNRAALARSLDNQATILIETTRFEEALGLLREAERMFRDLGDLAGVQSNLNNQSYALMQLNRPDDALHVLHEAERICRDLGLRDELARCLLPEATIILARGQTDEAIRLAGESVSILRALGHNRSLPAAIEILANAHYARGALDKALELYAEEARLWGELEIKLPMAHAVGLQAAVSARKGNHENALRLLRQQEQLGRELQDKETIRISIASQGDLLSNLGDLQNALQRYEEEEILCRQSGDPRILSQNLEHQARLLFSLRQPDKALQLIGQEEELLQRAGDQKGVANCLGNRAVMLIHLGRLDEAMSVCREQERVCRALGEYAGLAASLSKQGFILMSRRELQSALRLFAQEQEIRQLIGDSPGLIACFDNQAMTAQQLGNPMDAKALLEKEERLCREFGNAEGLAICLAKQALVLAQDLGRPKEALPILEEANSQAVSHGLGTLAQQFGQMLGQLRHMVS